MIVLREQIEALYALRMAAPAVSLDTATDLRDDTVFGLVVAAPDGRRWLITADGRTHRYEEETTR